MKAMRILYTLLLLMGCTAAIAQKSSTISIETKHSCLLFTLAENHKLYQSYFGAKLSHENELSLLSNKRHDALITGGMEDQFEPAVRITHADGNPSLNLLVTDYRSQKKDDNVTLTTITLKDPQYPVQVEMKLESYHNEDLIKQWTEIKHSEKTPVILKNYASSLLHFDADQYWLTEYTGDWAKEVAQNETRLSPGIKIIDSKIGTRAYKYRSPFFFLSLNQPAKENSGEVIAGTLAWSGNYQFLFEMDEKNSLRTLSGINPYASEYKLKANELFITPAFLYTYSTQGKGQASRNFHNWARNYGLMDGHLPRLTLLNNWEATGTNFNEETLVHLFDGAAKLGVDLFLLDDGWFGNTYHRDNDKAALGDWQEDQRKLPSGIGYLVKHAAEKGIKFGIWLEPEMVNPQSELYKKHPDWILKLPNRDENYQRNQLVLDLCNPKVQDFVYDLVNNMMSKDPGIAFIKWDCNRTMSNTWSPYLKQDQSNLYVDYTKSLYKIMQRIRLKYPHLPIMLCSGGGGRTDYGALAYFTEFWPSDNTDGLDRIYIQWGYSQFFPSMAIAAHVTSWSKTQSIKFRTDVAMMGKLGYDIKVNDMKPEELQFSHAAVSNYKNWSDVIWQGDQYRLISPYENNRAALLYASKTKDKALLFYYNLYPRSREIFNKVKLEGLDPDRSYQVNEINLMPGVRSVIPENGQTFSGDYLMKIGLTMTNNKPLPMTSNLIELLAK
jgi:alpha-galactosidase